MDATVAAITDTGCDVDLGDGVQVPARMSETVALSPGDRVGLLMRPEMVRLMPAHDGETPRLKGKVVDEVYQGALRRYHVAADAHELVVEVPNRPELVQLAPGTDVELYWSAESGVAVP